MALQQGRNYGIDLLRMVAMFMVAVLHVLGQGGVLGSAVNSTQYHITWFLELAAYGSVNLFAMISGYVGVKSRFKAANLAALWVQVFFYSFGIAVIFAFFRPDLCSASDLLGYAFPVITRKYWYFSAYFSLFLFTPLLNAGLNALSKQTLRRLSVAMILVFSVAASAGKEASQDSFTLVGGYTGLWLMVLYVVGGYIGKYGMWENVPKPALFGIWLGCTALSFGLQFYLPKIVAYTPKFVISYISPLIVLGSIALLLFFSRLECGNAAKKLITIFSPAAFSVYIIHVHPLIWENVMHGRFSFLGTLHPLYIAGAVLLSAFGIYLVCSLIDLLRIQLFKLLRIKKGLSSLENKLFKEKQQIGNR